MPFEINLRVSASPEEVLKAIRGDLREWRESAIPPELRKEGVYRVVGSVKGTSFRLTLYRRAHTFYEPVVQGKVHAVADDKCEVIARCGHDRAILYGIPVLVALWVLLSLPGPGSPSPWGIIPAVIVIAAIYLVRDQAITRGVPEAALLERRLRSAAERAERTSGAKS